MRIPSFLRFYAFRNLVMLRARGFDRGSPFFTETLASCFYTSASQCVERDAINATRPVF